MNIELDCPGCAGRLTFAARRRSGSGRLVGSCAGCASVYSLYGGRVTPIDLALPRRPSLPGWGFGALVAGERSLALRRAGFDAAPTAVD